MKIDVEEKLEQLAQTVEELQNAQHSIREGKQELEQGDGLEEVVVPNVPQGISTKTIVSVITSVIVILNLAFSMLAPTFHIDIAEDTLYTVGSLLAIVINFGYVMYKDHNFSKNARRRNEVADQVLPKKEQ